MSRKRTLLSGVLFVPLCLALTGTAAVAAEPAHTLPLTTGWWPGGASSQEDSAVYAGIGGAGVLHQESGTDGWGNVWNEQHGSVAGIGGAAVLHGESEASGRGDSRPTATTDPARSASATRPAGTSRSASAPAVDQGSASAPVAAPVRAKVAKRHAAPAKSEPALRRKEAVTPVKKAAPAHAVSAAEPRTTKAGHQRSGTRPDRASRHVQDSSSYHQGTTSAGPAGAASSNVASSAGRDYAAYAASSLTAGPEGATSSGTSALAVPGAAAFRTWDVAAGPTGAYSHSTETSTGVGGHDVD
ncbi:hypothetical protein [Amycolatopsis jiangsuensis]|uniref:Uncharacterized protein n=1 Tax=Amycolatopsis jiangsuensis TaxID=1181879 RepID=A0A840IYX4_9PSEU|nr:hypothetical protein [Amycolatopsis jiangsuensis]MBB4686893.1 hypothetical protein [Amycolatopsis jiangsuensis]